MICYKILLLCALMEQIVTFQVENIYSDANLKILVPTLKSKNQNCRNHTVFYVEELKKMRLWATEMFDASSKFPSGVLFGSTHNFGSFDECLGVDVPLEGEHLKGRYCMAKFHVEPPNLEKDDHEFFRFYKQRFVNASAWDKVIAYSNDRRYASRNDFYLSYCIPSFCQYGDLQFSLQEVTEQFNAVNDFKVTVTVNPRSCQVQEETTFSTADITFISVVSFIVVLVLLATLYDWLMKTDVLKKCKLEGNMHELVMAFSFWANLNKLNSEKKEDEDLRCIHGLKVYSMFLIIAGHTTMFIAGSPLINPNFIESRYEMIQGTIFWNGPIIVDSFFTITGFLVCYLMLTQFEKRNKNINFIFLCLHRFIRLTPAYAVVLAFYCTLFIKIDSGPLWLEKVQVEQERCIANWWTNLLYLNNYVSKDHICMFQSWYLTCDMHFFLVALLVMWLLRKNKFFGIVALFTIIILSTSAIFATVYLNDEDPIVKAYMNVLKDIVSNSTFRNIYIPSHLRASPYFIGMSVGYLKYLMRARKYKVPKYLVYIGWIMCPLVMVATIYSGFIFFIPGKPYDPLVPAFYSSLHHVAWSCSISWMILAISEGNGAWVEPILSWRAVVPLSRITYTAFVCHGAVLLYTMGTLRHAVYVGVYPFVFYSSAHIFLSYVCGLFLSLLFEAPIIGLEKILLRKDPHNRNGGSSQ